MIYIALVIKFQHILGRRCIHLEILGFLQIIYPDCWQKVKTWCATIYTYTFNEDVSALMHPPALCPPCRPKIMAWEHLQTGRQTETHTGGTDFIPWTAVAKIEKNLKTSRCGSLTTSSCFVTSYPDQNNRGLCTKEFIIAEPLAHSFHCTDDLSHVLLGHTDEWHDHVMPSLSLVCWIYKPLQDHIYLFCLLLQP